MNKADIIAAIRRVAEADTDNFAALVRLSGLDPATDFVNADLSGIDLRHMDLGGYDLCGCLVSRGALPEGAATDVIPVDVTFVPHDDKVSQDRALSRESDAEVKPNLSISDERIGDILARQGDLGGALEAYRAELDRSNAELEQFANVVRRNLREPTRMIVSFLMLLERKYGPVLESDGKEFLGYALDGVKRMDQTFVGLLEFSRIERKGSSIAIIEADTALGRALHNLSAAIIEAGATVNVQKGTSPPRVIGAFDQIVRVFQNLIDNGLKFRVEGRAPVIHVTWQRQGSMWEFAVTDNGIGIANNHFEDIFRIFHRLPTKDFYDGTGIGLAICKKVIEQHGGRIWVESNQGKGSTFRLTLPAAPQE